MRNFGHSPSAQFSRLHDEEEHEDIPYNTSSPVPMKDDEEGKRSVCPTTPPRGKRMLQSMACVTGSPKRKPEEDNNDQHGNVNDYKDDESESPETSPRQVEKKDTDDESRQQSQASSQRQRQLDEALHSVISSDSAATQQFQNKSLLEQGLGMQPTYDDAYVVFENPNSEVGTNVSQTIIQEGSTVEPSPAEPVILSSSSLSCPKNDIKANEGGSSVPTGEDYNNVESLIARVKRLDAMVQAGEAQEAARTAEHASRSISRDLSPVEAQDSSKQEQDSTKPIRPIDSPRRDSPIRQRMSQEEDDQQDDEGMNEVVEDGSQHFQVLYRRGRDSPLSSQVKTSVATSSIVTMSSFHIPGIPVMQKAVPIVTPPMQKSHLADQVTAHPFFWRTHPREMFTSYGPNRPKTKLAFLQNGNRQAVLKTPNVYVGSRSMRMQTVSELGEQKYDTRYRETNARATFWSKDSDPVAESPTLHDGRTGFSPYGDDTGGTHNSAQNAARVSPEPPDASSWVAFSSFSAGSAEGFW